MKRKQEGPANEPYTKFKLFLTKNNIPQRDIADLIGRSISTVNMNINGTGDFRGREIEKICSEYGISSDSYFFSKEVSI